MVQDSKTTRRVLDSIVSVAFFLGNLLADICSPQFSSYTSRSCSRSTWKASGFLLLMISGELTLRNFSVMLYCQAHHCYFAKFPLFSQGFSVVFEKSYLQELFWIVGCVIHTDCLCLILEPRSSGPPSWKESSKFETLFPTLETGGDDHTAFPAQTGNAVGSLCHHIQNGSDPFWLVKASGKHQAICRQRSLVLPWRTIFCLSSDLHYFSQRLRNQLTLASLPVTALSPEKKHAVQFGLLLRSTDRPLSAGGEISL